MKIHICDTDYQNFWGEKTGDFIYGWPLRGVTFTHNNTEAVGRGQIRKMHILWQKLIHLTFVKITSLRLQMSIIIRINENVASYFCCDNIMVVTFTSRCRRLGTKALPFFTTGE